eukprot:Gb_24158 [translate_table: standard]
MIRSRCFGLEFLLVFFVSKAWLMESHVAEYDMGLSTRNHKFSVLIAFGDSTVDSGNNDYLLSAFKSNFPPYGRDFIDHKPTGRFCNGKLATDFVAAGLGIKETIPPYLDPHLTIEDLITGVSFASAGSGYDNFTAQIGFVIPLWKQMDYFNQYRMRLTKAIGEKKMCNLIRETLFVSSMGTNDFIENYFRLPIRKNQFSISEYEDFLIQISRGSIEDLYRLGARKIAVLGLPPAGCLPRQKTEHFSKANECVDGLNQVVIDFNAKLKAAIFSLKTHLPELKIAYVDIYDVVLDAVNNPSKYGFEVSSRGCCGTGLTELGPTCNAKTPFTCTDASKFVFWDSVHATERTYELVANLTLKLYLPELL